MKNILTITVFVVTLNLLVILPVESAEKAFKFTIINANNEVAIKGSFECDDSNGDGWIDETELKSLSEKVFQTCLSGKIQRKGWQKFVEEKEYPKIIHTLQDVKKFRFGIHEWSKGKTILEFETDTDKYERFSLRGYLFWRKTELKENGSQVVFLNGVSDGKEGVVFCMSEVKNLHVNLESTDK